MTHLPTTLMQPIADAARIAGKTALKRFRTHIPVETKADGSPVTVADREAESAARAWIEEYFPEDGILGEEWGLTRPEAARRWILDPIDGTRSFVRGVPLWGSLVAVMEGARVLASAVYLPALGEVIVAGHQASCWWNGVECAVSNVKRLTEATLVTTDDRFLGAPAKREAWERLARRAAVVRTWGDCYGYALVATGRAEVMLDSGLQLWDAAPVRLIVEEAGGRFGDWTGSEALEGDVVATNGGVAEETLKLLATAGEPQASE